MEYTREERMQQRLRGAQRQVRDVDFGFMLPAFAAPPAASPTPVIQNQIPEAPVNQGTPQPELPLKATVQTPSTASRTRDTPSNILGLKSNNVAKSNTGNDANTSAKRRKLEIDAPPSSSARSMRSSRSSAKKDIYDLPEDDEPEQTVVEELNLPLSGSLENSVDESAIVATAPAAPEVPIPSIESDLPNEVVIAREDEELSRSADQSLQEAIAQSVVDEPESPKILPRPSRNKRKRDEPPLEPQETDEPAVTETDTTSDSVQKILPKAPRRSRRKSSLQEETEGNDIEENPGDSTEQAEEIDDYKAAITLKKNRGRRVSRNMVVPDEPIEEDPAPPISPIAKKKRGRVRQIDSPVQQRQPAPPKPKTQRPDKRNKRQKAREGTPIPVTVHRLTKGPVYNDDDFDAELLNSGVPCVSRAGVNAVDVLSQICQELTTTALETLGDNAVRIQDAAQRNEFKTKIKAVENFSKELQIRLLEHTVNLDNSYSLEKRLRDGQKKKLSLREEILRVRAKREKVALRMDEIRINHEKESHDARQREILNTTVHDVELAVERGKFSANDSDNDNNRKPNIELMLRRVAAEASSVSNEGGVLKQIKAFNAFMERAALALEGRKSTDGL